VGLELKKNLKRNLSEDWSVAQRGDQQRKGTNSTEDSQWQVLGWKEYCECSHDVGQACHWDEADDTRKELLPVSEVWGRE
jgi:hypothetical protein